MKDAELARLMLVCGGRDMVRCVVGVENRVDGGVDRGVVVTAVDGDDLTDGGPLESEPPDEPVVVAESTASDDDGSDDDAVTVPEDPGPCTAEVGGAVVSEMEDAVGIGPSVCGSG